ncbi:AraC family transcriptional regulator [Aeromonas hydrophila]|uniref:AraC family transcriptional regulator n=1 Tax=Aeromonas hydrophila TaxID=644 RepID=UPI00083C95DD|nr:AraC family transcriptional regulator [Aeromonas hydrophila]OCX98883.1 AraC family transcriptional regulator [Aeromonas hydrophila]HAU4922996.1 AraC family transcriptional regulator [Aeromonas hydrophila]
MDPLSVLLAHTTPRAQLFFAGNLCQNSNSQDYPAGGHLHLLRSGELTLYHEGAEPHLLTEQTLLLFPSGLPHRMEPRQLGGCDLVCASVSFGQGSTSPLQLALPDVLVLPLNDMPTLAPLLNMLFDEAFAHRYGQDPRLARAIAAMHLRSEEGWTVATLAQEAGMSRARFAAHFQSQTGLSPLGYLTQWRMLLASQQLQAGKSIIQVALGAGYSGSIAFSRAFEREFGLSPGRWIKAIQ